MVLTVKQAAARLGVHPSRVRQLITQKRIKATRFGRDWSIKPEALDRYQPKPSGGQVKGVKIKAASVTRRKYARNS